MSILPFNKPASTDSSYTIPSQTPSRDFNHGFLPPSQQQQQQQQQQRRQQQPVHSFHQSPPISDSAFAFSPDQSPNLSGSPSLPPADRDGSPAKIKEREKQQADQNLAHVEVLHHEGASQAGFGSIMHQRKSSTSAVNPNTNRTSTGPASHGASSNSSGRKTQIVNGNHLLNFHYDAISRPHPRTWAPPPRRQPKRKPYNKDLFLQANYKFVMLDSGNYAPELMDPDKMLLWEDIICLKYFTPVQVQCPICFDYPLCPQITSCGHIFCFPCILQYLMLDGDDHKAEYTKKCPLCFMMVSSKDIFTICIKNVKQYHVGDAIEFWLLTRQKDSFVLSLKNNEGINAVDEDEASFCKFTFTSDINLSVMEGMSDLDSWLAKADSGLVDDLEKLPYVCAAIKLLEERQKYWKERQQAISMVCGRNSSSATFPGPSNAAKISNIGINVCESASSLPACSRNKQSVWLQNSTLDKSTNLVVTSGVPKSSDDYAVLSPSLVKGNNNSLQTEVDGCDGGKNRDSYNFYQAVDGQNLILHPLNMKCLLHYYGSYDRLPNRITGNILQFESVTQSEAMRKRYRYLSHFSLTATFQFCEIDLGERLPADALSPFMDEINNREKQRKRLARKEQHEKMKAKAAGLHFMPTIVNLERNFHHESPATFSMDDFEALGACTSTSSGPADIGERQSFSNVARLGFAAGHDSQPLRREDADSKMDFPRDSSGASVVKSSSGPSFASVTSRGKAAEKREDTEVNKMGKKGKKASRVLMSTSGGRRY